MTREEFEAVLAVEGKFILMRVATYGGRLKKHAMFKALVWEWTDTPTFAYHRRRILYGNVGLPQPEEIERMQFVLGSTHWEPTNHRAVKHLMKAWEKGLF